MIRTVLVTYAAFEPIPVAFAFELPVAVAAKLSGDPVEDGPEVAEHVFAETNRYGGELWDAMKPGLAETADRRRHTALSVGDFVSYDGRHYRCEPFGFQLVPSAG